MSIEAALRRVAELVEGTSPATGQRLVWQDPDAGQVPALEAAPESGDRLFEVAVASTDDAGEGGCIPARVRVSAQLRIRYRTAGSRMARTVAQADDVRRLRDALMFAPASYSAPSTGLLAVTLGAQSVAPVLNIGQTAPTHEILTLPLTLEVRP